MSHQELFEQFRSIRGIARQNDLSAKEMAAWVAWVRGVYEHDLLFSLMQAIVDLRLELNDKLHALAVQIALTREALERITGTGPARPDTQTEEGGINDRVRGSDS